MPKVAVYNMQGEQVDEIALNDRVFGVKVNGPLMHQAVVAYLANQRQGTSKTKNRSEVRGGGRKPWRQKGTGRARQGSIRSPQWVGGGTVFGPTPRDFSIRLPRKIRRAALKSALSAKVNAGEFIVVDHLNLDAPKTAVMVDVLRKLNVDRKALVVTPEGDRNVILSARNLQGIKTQRATDLNTYEVLLYDKIVITKDAIAKVEEVLG